MSRESDRFKVVDRNPIPPVGSARQHGGRGDAVPSPEGLEDWSLSDTALGELFADESWLDDPSGADGDDFTDPSPPLPPDTPF